MPWRRAASATTSSRNVLFLLVLAAATLLTAVDPWYRATILRHPWAASLLFGFTLFATLKVALAPGPQPLNTLLPLGQPLPRNRASNYCWDARS
jgi:hypothetical protein